MASDTTDLRKVSMTKLVRTDSDVEVAETFGDAVEAAVSSAPEDKPAAPSCDAVLQMSQVPRCAAALQMLNLRCVLEAGHVGKHVSGSSYRWDESITATGRTSAKSPPIANMPRSSATRDLAKRLLFAEQGGLVPRERPISRERAEQLVKDLDDNPDFAIARRMAYADMQCEILNEWEWARIFDARYVVKIGRQIALQAVERASRLGVPPNAETSVSPCGCIWALQTTYITGQGDVLLRTCAQHSPKSRLPKLDK